MQDQGPNRSNLCNTAKWQIALHTQGKSYLRFIDDAEYIQTRDGTSILCGLALGVVEVSGYCDNGMGDLLAKVSLSSFLAKS